MEIILATTNSHKIQEFRAMFRAVPHLELISLHAFNDYQPPEETGLTFKENAILKANHAAHHFQKWALADDSGLVLPILNGEPGVYSRRYAGPQASDSDNRQKLLKALEPYEEHQRVAYFECSLALVGPKGIKKCVEGICEGKIIYQSRGRQGFGYDCLFIKNDYEKTFAELEEGVKNRISHRRKAFERLLNVLESLKDS